MKYKNLENKKYNHLTFIEFSHMDVSSYWFVKCDCGNEFITKASTVVNNDRKSCGCISKQRRLTEKQRLLNRSLMILENLEKITI
jgi:hypothetical protein